MTADPVRDKGAGNFKSCATSAFISLRRDSPAWRLGSQRIPLQKIGLYHDDPRSSLSDHWTSKRHHNSPAIHCPHGELAPGQY